MPARKSLVASRLSPLAFLLALAPPGDPQSSLFVTSRFTDEVLRYDATSGAFLGVFASGGGLDNPVGLTFGPDGHLYVVSAETDQVLRYDGASGAFLGVFAAGGGLDAPRQLGFGPDGALYVASGATNAVLRFDGTTGAFRDVFASGGGINGPTSFTFGPGGDLFVGSVLNDRIKRFDGASGAFLGNFVSTRIDGPHDFAFGPDGFLYVSNAFDARILRFDGASGVFHDVFVQDAALSAALGLCWDEQGALLVVNQGRDEVRRYDGASGAFLGLAVAPGAGGVSAPLFACFEPSAGLRLRAPLPGIAGVDNLAVLSGATPGALLWLAIGDRPALWRVPGCTPLGMPASLLHFVRVADESGRAFVRQLVPPSLAGRRLFARALEPASCRASPIELVRF
jgi:hypothetical protein